MFESVNYSVGDFDSDLTDLLFELKSFHHKKNVISSALFDITGDKIYVNKWNTVAQKMDECGTFIEYDTTDKRITHSNFCRQRCCPLCQRRRSLEMYSRLSVITEQMFGYELLHVVLTCPNCYGDELSCTIDRLISASRKLFNKKIIKQGWKGVARFIEVTYSEQYNNFHPHLHCLVLVKPSYFKSRYYIKQELLQALWSDLYGCDCIAYVSKANKSALPEVAKYCVKPFEMKSIDKNIKAFTMIYDALRSRRLVQFFGDFKKFSNCFDDESAFDCDFEIINPIIKFSYYNNKWNVI